MTIDRGRIVSAGDKQPTRGKRVLIILAVIALAAVGALIFGFFNHHRGSVSDTGAVGVEVGSADGVGELLVDADGRTLYIFEPDEQNEVTCTGACAAKWPPLVTRDAKPQVGDGIDTSLIATVEDQAGEQVVTFDGWPLYRYTSDKRGEVTGSGKDQNGGVWWALTPDGERVKTD